MTRVSAALVALLLVITSACAGERPRELGGADSFVDGEPRRDGSIPLVDQRVADQGGASDQGGAADQGSASDQGAAPDHGASADGAPTGQCPTTWSLRLPEAAKDVVVEPGGTAYVAARSGSQAYVAAIDKCGKMLSSKTFSAPGAASTAGTGITSLGGKLYVAGNMVSQSGVDPRDGFVAQLDPASLNVDWTSRLNGSAGADEVWDVEALGGALWVTGNLGGTGKTWVAKVAPKQQICAAPCGFSPFGGGGRRMFAGSGKLYLGGWIPEPSPGKLKEAFVINYDATAQCDTPPCKFNSSSSVIFKDAENSVARSSEIRGLVVVGDDAYTVGFSHDKGSSDLRGFVVRINLLTAKGDVYVLDLPKSKEGFVGVATDGTHIYAVGGQGWDNDISKVQPVIVKLTMPDLKEVWKRTPPDKGFYNSVRVVGGNGLLIVGGDPAGVVRRCLTDGSC